MNNNLTGHIKYKLNLLLNMLLGKEYSYSCIPLAVIDAVYSIRQSYKKTQEIVANYCGYYKITEFKSDNKNMKIHTVSDLLGNIEKLGAKAFADDVLKSENKTAGANPMLKSEAVYQWGKVLLEHKIEAFDDLKQADLAQLEKDLRKIHGQGEAVVKYFFMLCGDDNFCKPDRHLLKFLSDALGHDVKEDEAQKLLEKSVEDLKDEYPHMTVRLLDYIIWSYQKNN